MALGDGSDGKANWVDLVIRLPKYLSWLLRSNGMAAWRQAQEIVWEKHNGSNFHADRFKRVHELVVQLYKRSTPCEEVYKRPVYTNDATARAVRRKRRPTHTGHIEAASYKSEDGGPRLMTSVLYERSCHGYADHPTQKPIGILRTLLEYSCPEKGMVLDLFCRQRLDSRGGCRSRLLCYRH